MNKITKLVVIGGLLAWGASAIGEEVVWAQGFNKSVTSWDEGSFGWQYGIVVPGVIQKDPPENTEGEWFCGANTSAPAIDGEQKALGRVVAMIVRSVKNAGEVYEFTGKIGWRYGTKGSADLLIFDKRTGFFSSSKAMNRLAGPVAPVRIGEIPQASWATMTWTYTTTENDIGKPIYVCVETHDRNNFPGLTQVLADDWKVTKR
jgi:hypothetical protein